MTWGSPSSPVIIRKAVNSADFAFDEEPAPEERSTAAAAAPAFLPPASPISTVSSAAGGPASASGPVVAATAAPLTNLDAPIAAAAIYGGPVSITRELCVTTATELSTPLKDIAISDTRSAQPNQLPYVDQSNKASIVSNGVAPVLDGLLLQIRLNRSGASRCCIFVLFFGAGAYTSQFSRCSILPP